MPIWIGIALLAGFCGLPVNIVNLIFKKVRNKPIKGTVIALVISAVLFLIGFVCTFFVYS